MKSYVLLLDIGGSAVKATAYGPGLRASTTGGYPVRVPAEGRVEVCGDDLFAAVLRAGAQTVAAAGAQTGAVAGAVAGAAAGAGCIAVVAATLRQGYALLDAHGAELAPLVSNTDRRGAEHRGVLAGRYELTGHWPAPELTLPKLLTVAEEAPELAAAARHLLFWHDWLLRRLGAELVSGVDYICGGGMADVAARGWARDWLAELGIPPGWLAPPVEAGTRVGTLSPEAAGPLGLPAGVPLLAGGGDTQMAVAGCGGLTAGTVTVVAGSSTPVQLTTDRPATDDPRRHPWVSTHLRPGLWAVEGNAGYPGTYWGTVRRLLGAASPDDAAVDAVPAGAGGLLALVAAPYWSEQAWARRPPVSLVGLAPDTSAAELVAAVEEAHGHGVRGNVADLERVAGQPLSVLVAGPRRVAQRVADAVGRPVRHSPEAGAAAAAWSLASGAPLPAPGPELAPRADRVAGLDAAYQAWLASQAL